MYHTICCHQVDDPWWRGHSKDYRYRTFYVHEPAPGGQHTAFHLANWEHSVTVLNVCRGNAEVDCPEYVLERFSSSKLGQLLDVHQANPHTEPLFSPRNRKISRGCPWNFKSRYLRSFALWIGTTLHLNFDAAKCPPGTGQSSTLQSLLRETRSTCYLLTMYQAS